MNRTQASAVLDRSGSMCEFCGAPGVQMSHLLHRKIGGRHGVLKAAINDPRNVAFLCLLCHNKLDGRQNGNRDSMMATLKAKIDWTSWAQEYGINRR
jgi:hypothetical protein